MARFPGLLDSMLPIFHIWITLMSGPESLQSTELSLGSSCDKVMVACCWAALQHIEDRLAPCGRT